MDTTPDTNNTTTPKVGSRWVLRIGQRPEAWFTVDRNGDRRWHAGEEAAKASARRLGDPAIARYTLAEVIRMDGAE